MAARVTKQQRHWRRAMQQRGKAEGNGTRARRSCWARRTTAAGAGSRSSPWRSKEEGGDRGRGALGEDGALREGEGEIERGGSSRALLARCMRLWVAAEGNERG